MDNRSRWDITATGADEGMAAPPARPRLDRRLIALMLFTAAALDLARCCLVLASARHPAPTAWPAAAGVAAAVVTARTARGCRVGQRWAGWAALLIGVGSGPQAAASGFHDPYTVPDTATAVLAILLTVTILAAAGRTGPPGQETGNPCFMDRNRTGDPAGQPGPHKPNGPRDVTRR